MRIIAVFELKDGAEKDFEIETWQLQHPGIKVISHREQSAEYEYASFIWDKMLGKYEQVNRAVCSEQLCRNRLQEYISNGYLNKGYDTSKTVIKRRIVTTVTGEWEELKGEN